MKVKKLTKGFFYNLLSKDVKEFNSTFLSLFCLLFLIVCGFISFKVNGSYALFSTVVNGENTIRVEFGKEVFINDVNYVSNVNADLDASEFISFDKTSFSNVVSLSKDDGNSSITYNVSIYNSSDEDAKFIGTSCGILFESNKNIICSVNGISSGDIIKSKEYLNFDVTFHYVDDSLPVVGDKTYIENYNFLQSTIDFNFGEYTLDVVEQDVYSIYAQSEGVPVILNNNNDFEISGVVKYGDTILVDNFILPANSTNNIINVDISKIYSKLKDGEDYSLSVVTVSPRSEIYDDAVSFIKEQSMVSITNVDAYLNGVLLDDADFSYSENTLNINNVLNSTNKKIEYKITVKNNSTVDVYKFRNITELFNTNTVSNYTSSVDLADGILINPLKTLTFTISYSYNSSVSDNTHKQILLFDFRYNYKFGAVSDNLITLSTPDINTKSTFGDFGLVSKDSSTYKSPQCDYVTCYSANNGYFEYDSKGGLVLDEDNTIGTINIDQSMGVGDEFSAYVTLKGDTNQFGNDGKFPGTVIAISDEANAYLFWLGFYKGYMHVYSYRAGSSMGSRDYEVLDEVGYVSVSASKYSNKIINIQVVAKRGGNATVYVNGTKFVTFPVGDSVIEFSAATIGDLRPGRNLKFNGTIYDVALYNRALTSSEVNINWLYAKEVWGIS